MISPPRRLAPVAWYVVWAASALFAYAGVRYAFSVGLGYDAHAYWGAWRHGLYDVPPLSKDAYLYSPAFAQVIWPLTLLPWRIFELIWGSAAVVAFLWLLRPLGIRWGAPAFVACIPEIVTGNVYAFMALSLALSLSHPAAWALPALTKVAPGVVGPVCFAARGDWPRVVRSVSAISLVAAVSYLAAPHLWHDWLRFLRTHSEQSSARLTAALWLSGLVCAALATRKNRAWLLVPATVLLSPTFSLNTLTLAAALPRLLTGARETAEESTIGRE